MIEIVTDPEDARVYRQRDGALVGLTPLRTPVAPAQGDLSLVIRKLGYHDKIIVILVGAGPRPEAFTQRNVLEPWSWRADGVTKLPAQLLRRSESD